MEGTLGKNGTGRRYGDGGEVFRRQWRKEQSSLEFRNETDVPEMDQGAKTGRNRREGEEERR